MEIAFAEITCTGRAVINTASALRLEIEKIPRKRCIVNYPSIKEMQKWPLCGGNYIFRDLFISSHAQAKSVKFLKYFGIKKCINISGEPNANDLPTI
jgi:hypothetical protein